MQVDVLIIGQGICGTMLSWFLHKEGKQFLLIDDNVDHTASRVAAGIINPVTGRRYATTWLDETLLPFAQQTYTEIGEFLGASLFSARSILDFFPSPQMRNAFVDRISENNTYLHAYPDQNLFNPFFNYDFGCGEIRPAYTVHMQDLLSLWKQQLQAWQAIRQEQFSGADLKINADSISYGDVTAQKIVFCNGIAAAEHPLFSLLPFSPNKGEALIIECKELNREHCFKKGMLLVPLPQDNMFWLGSNYQWEFDHAEPTEAFYTLAKNLLQHWLKKPFTIVDHKAAIRPATVERRPFVGFHPQLPSVGLLNGMGTKGTSLAPFFAHQLVQHLVHQLPLSPEADLRRYSRILSK